MNERSHSAFFLAEGPSSGQMPIVADRSKQVMATLFSFVVIGERVGR